MNSWIVPLNNKLIPGGGFPKWFTAPETANSTNRTSSSMSLEENRQDEDDVDWDLPGLAVYDM